MKKVPILLIILIGVFLFPIAVPAQGGKDLKRKVAIGRFTNETQYAKGLFYDRENDPMRKQALDILSTKLGASGKFILLERDDLDLLMKEITENGGSSNKIGADYMIVGSITEFGRKNLGKSGVFTSQKSQIVQAGVSIRLIDVSTGLIIYTDEAKGEAETTSKKTFGIGGSADFDASLSDKAISAAISQLVQNIINKCMNKPWRAYILANQSPNEVIISGGASQGIVVGDKFNIVENGKLVTNPQTGIKISLPGKAVGSIAIESMGGDTPEAEFSIAKIEGITIPDDQLSNYHIEEIK